VASAISKCTANQGDWIFVMPGHTEILDGDLNMNVAGVTLMGMGVTMSRPTFDFLAAGDTINLTAANCRVSNIICSLDNSAVTVTAAFTVAASGCTIDNTRIMPHATSQFTGLCDIGDFDDVTIAYNSWYTLAGTSSATGIRITGTAERCKIIGNFVYGNFSGFILSALAAALDLTIADNVMGNGNSADLIHVVANTTGQVHNNAFATGAADVAAGTWDFEAMMCTENFMVNVLTETGGPVPAAAAA
jgi:hypothetical protein